MTTALALLAAMASAKAQEAPAGQSCGGLLCDLGVLGHKTSPAAPVETPAPAPVSVPVRPSEALAPTPRAATAAKPRRRVVRRRASLPKVAAAPEPTPQRAAPSPRATAAPAPPPVAASAAPPPRFVFPPIDPTLYR